MVVTTVTVTAAGNMKPQEIRTAMTSEATVMLTVRLV